MTEAPGSGFADTYTKGGFKAFLEELRIPKSRFPVSLIRFAQPAGDFSDPANDDLVLQVPHRSYEGTYDFGGGRHSTMLVAGSICLVPASVRATYLLEDQNAATGLGIRQDAIQHLIDEACGRPVREFGSLHRKAFRDELCRRLVRAVWDEAAADNPAGQMFIDGAVMSLIARLAKLSGRKLPGDTASCALDDPHLARVVDYVEAHLDERTCIGDLAALVGMRDYEFSRAFKASTNVAPYQFVIDRRIERARSLLEATERPLADIAYACGFASQSHMTDVFRVKLGVTPGRYRKERRS
jgi:AraC family transcriptional regulator